MDDLRQELARGVAGAIWSFLEKSPEQERMELLRWVLSHFYFGFSQVRAEKVLAQLQNLNTRDERINLLAVILFNFLEQRPLWPKAEAPNLREFLGETGKILEAINRDLLALDQPVRHGKGKLDPAVINNIFRGVHSLKGISGLFGFAKMTQLSHKLETLIDCLRQQKVELTSQVLDLLSESIEMVESLVKLKEKGQEVDEEKLEGLLLRLEITSSGRGDDFLASAGVGREISDRLSELEEVCLRENINQGKNLFLCHLTLDLQNFDEELAKVQEQAKQLGERITTLPGSEAFSDEEITFLLLLASDHNLDQVKETFSAQNVKVEQLRAPTKSQT